MPACVDDNDLAAYLEGRLAADRGAPIKAHLDQCESCLAVMCAIATERGGGDGDGGGGGDRGAADDDRLPNEPGSRVGRYQLQRMIGRGGMGTVYVAVDPQLGREVAIKVVHADAAANIAELSREARAMAKISHANVVAVFDAGELATGVFIAMELVRGDTLSRWLVARPRSWPEIVRIFLAAGRGLEAAHQVGVVHRDFKPDNVLVDERDQPAVGDFGLATSHRIVATPIAQLSLATVETLTRTGLAGGTPRYMAPEQFRGEPVDAKSDQFSFAVALYEALYRQLPYPGETVEDLDHAFAGAPRPPPKTSVPAAIEAALRRALAVDPARRFPALGAVLDELERSLARSTRKRWTVAVVSVVAVAAIAGGVVIVSRPAAAPAPARAATGAREVVLMLPFANTTGDAGLDGVLELAVADEIARSRRFDTVSGVELVDLAEQLATEVRDPDLVHKLQDLDQRRIHGLGGSIARTPAGYDVRLDGDGIRLHEVAATRDDLLATAHRLGVRARQALGDPMQGAPVVDSPSPSLEALASFETGQLLAARDQLDDAIARYRRAIELDPGFVEARVSLAATYYNQGNRSGSLAELAHAIKDTARAPERLRFTLLGDYYAAAGDYSAALSSYQQLLSRWPDDSRTQISIAETALDAGQWPLALDFLGRAMVDHANLPSLHRDLVVALLADGRYDDAVTAGERVVATMPESAVETYPAVAAAYALAGRSADAAKILDALATQDRDAADQIRADLALFAGRLDDAAAILDPRLAPAPDAPAADASVRAGDLLLRARLHARRGDKALAVTDLGAALPALRAGSDAVSAYLALTSEIDLGEVTAAQAAARDWLKRDEPAWRAYGALLSADLALQRGDTAGAIDSYLALLHDHPSWLVHAQLARAYARAGSTAAAGADRERAWCQAHRGELAALPRPSLSLLPPVDAAPAR